MYPPLAAGITGYIHDVAEQSARDGHEVHVRTTGSSGSDLRLSCGTQVHHHREYGRLMACPISPALVTRVALERADVLHLHMPCPTSELGVLANRRGTPIVVSFHARLGRQRGLEPFYAPLRTALLRRAFRVLVSSPTMAAAPELALAGGKIEVNPYGSSPRLRSTQSDVPRRNGSDRELRLLFVGRLVYYKGVEVLIRALASAGDGISLTIIGEGPMDSELRSLSASLGVSDSVAFLGAVDDDQLRAAYGDHDVFVLPSISQAEAFGLALVEAMAAGLPAISTELGTGTSWVNVDGESGLVVPPGDVDALVEAIESMRPPALRRRLSEGAKSRADTVFGFERHCDRLHEIYAMACRLRTE